MEMRESFFGEDVDREGHARRIGETPRPVAKLGDHAVVQVVRIGGKKLRRIPVVAFLFVFRHELTDGLFEIGEHLELGGKCGTP